MNLQVATPDQTITPEQYADMAIMEAERRVQEATGILTRAKEVKVTNEKEYRDADDACGAIKTAMKGADAKRDELVRPFNTAVKKVNARFKDAENAFNSALSAYRAPMTAFQAELERQRREAAAAAEAERKRLQAIADEEARLEREKAEKAAQEAREAAAAAAAIEDPFEAALAHESAQERAMEAQAASEAYKQTVREVAKVNVAPVDTPKVTGGASKTYTIWEYEITDPDLVPMIYRPINEAMIAKAVKEQKGNCSIPGVKVTSRPEVK